MKKISFLFLPFFLVAGLCAFCLWWYVNTKPVNNNKTFSGFTITKGSAISLIGQRLKEANLIRSPLAFKFYVQVSGKQNKIQAGEFRLTASDSLFKIVDQLTRGPEELWVTIPEGLRREEIVERFIDVLGKEGEEATSFRSEFLLKSQDKEGYLFPDTYLFPRVASASAVVNKMLATFDKRLNDQMRQDLTGSDYTLSEVVVLASLIERETRTDDERPVVAGVLYNRLAIGMPLQVDASVQYAWGSYKCRNTVGKCDWWLQTTISDRQINSPFNTYRIAGLPPFPIANPGLSSLKAAIYPEETDYLYYLHDSQGGIHFAKSLEAHNKNVDLYIK